MQPSPWKLTQVLGIACLIALVAPSPVGANTFGGRAFSAFIRVPTLGAGPMYLADAGALSPEGGFSGTGLLGAQVPLVLSARVLHAAIAGAEYELLGGRTDSAASLSNVVLLPGHIAQVTVSFVRAQAEATDFGAAGGTEIEQLTFGGTPIVVTGVPNQRVEIPGLLGPLATLIINEQIPASDGTQGITVNALHLFLATGDEVILASARSVVDPTAEAILASTQQGLDGTTLLTRSRWWGRSARVEPILLASAASASLAARYLAASSARRLHRMPSPCFDFTSGSGWFAPTPAGPERATFAFNAGRAADGTLKADLSYVDENTGMSVKGTSITDYQASGEGSRIFKGAAQINGVSGFTYLVEVADDGESGGDRFRIALSNGYSADSGGAGHPTDPVGIDAGNIRIHEPCPPKDTTAPTVAITSPADGATVSGTIMVKASASDNQAVEGVLFQANGVSLAPEDRTAPYEVSWDTTVTTDGSYALTAVARDVAGNITTSWPVTVTVANGGGDSVPPTVAITSPSSGATLSGPVTVSASASDNVKVAGVQFFVDGVKLGAEDTAEPYSVAWDTTSAANGDHSLTAVARDGANNTATSSPVMVTVANGGTGAEAVVWTDLRHVTATGSSLQKTSGCDGCQDAGAVSVQTIASGDGFVEFTASETNTTRVAGLSNGNTDTTRADIDFGIQLGVGGGVDVREKGVYRADTTYVSGDRFRVAVEAGVVKYSKNGAVFYTSAVAPTFPLLLDTSIYTRNGTVTNAVISGGAGGGGDTTPPTVAITSPSSGATVSGGVTVKASASDNVGVAGVQFFVDGVKLGAEDMAAPYSVPWDTTTAADGDHALTAVARDAANNTATSPPVMVTVANGTAGGVTRVEQTDPSIIYSGSWVQGDMSRAWSGGTAAFSGEAGARATLSFSGTGASWIGFRGPQTGIARVFLDGTLVATVDSFSSAEEVQAVMFTASGLASGAHTLAVEVTGAKNASSTNNLVVVDAFDVTSAAGGGGDTTAPSVAITSPGSGATVSGSTTISASASDNVGVAGVQFFVDGVKLGAEDMAAPYSVPWDTTTVADGSHDLTAVARDGAGNTATSAPVTVMVANGGGGGTVTRLEETDPSITYTANWFERFADGYSGGKAMAAETAGERATLTFTGTGVRWISRRDPVTGIARVYLDGKLVAEVDTYSPTSQFQVVLYSASGMPAGPHTLTIEVTGTWNPAGCCRWIVVDAFDVTN